LALQFFRIVIIKLSTADLPDAGRVVENHRVRLQHALTCDFKGGFESLMPSGLKRWNQDIISFWT